MAHEDVVVGIEIAARPETVWLFLSDAERFASWIGAFAGAAPAPGTRIEPRVGGGVKVDYPHSGAAVGRILELEPPRRVLFSWGYEGGGQGIEPESTQVEITLRETPGGTFVELRHRGLPSEEARRGHRGGWTHYLTMLARSATDQQHASGSAQRVAAWFAAWSAPEEVERAALLERCVTEEVHVRTSFASIDSRAGLSAHIAGALQHMPGFRSELDGLPQHLFGYLRFRWLVRAPDGSIVMRGTNFASLSLDGRIRGLISFPDAVG